MGKILGILFGFSLVLLIGVLAIRVYPAEVARFIPQNVAQMFNIDTPSALEPSNSVTLETGLKDGPENPDTEAEEDVEPRPPEELESVDALIARGENFLNAEFLSLAINDFSRATELTPENRLVWSKLIGTQIALQDYIAAEESANRAILLFPGDRELLTLLGETHLQKSEFSQAQKIFEKLPQGGGRQFYLGLMSAYFEDYETSKNFLAEAKNNPEFGEKAKILLSAYEEFSLFPEGNPLHLQLLLSKAFDKLHFYEMAVQSTKKILKTREDYRDAWLILGHSYLSLERNDLAKNVLSQALELDPTKPETSFFLGLAEKALGETDLAITHLSMARENGYVPQYEATRALAEAFLEGKYYDAARQEYEKLLEIRGAPVDKYIQPVRISIEFLKDPKTAKNIAGQAVQSYPDSEIAQNLLAWSLLENNELNEAETLLKKVTENFPKFAPARLNMGKLYEKKAEFEQALEQYKAAYDLDPHSEVGAMAAESYNAIVLKEETGNGEQESRNREQGT